MLGEGDRIPEATVWVGPHLRTSVEQLVAEGPILLLFYHFDWSST